jgi:prolipoprotein diacylglyceryltransferase
MEAAWTLILLAGAPLAWPVLPFPGALFLYLLGGYGLGRLALESYRERAQAVWGLNAQHAISAGLVSVSVAGFVMAWLW